MLWDLPACYGNWQRLYIGVLNYSTISFDCRQGDSYILKYIQSVEVSVDISKLLTNPGLLRISVDVKFYNTIVTC